MYSALDDFVMNNLHEFNARKLVTIETADITDDRQADAEKEKPSV